MTSAHHGWSTDDVTRTVAITAPISAIRWANPHGAAAVRYQGKRRDGGCAPVLRRAQRDLTADRLRKAKTVTLIGQQRVDGTPEMKIRRILVDGKAYDLLA